MVSVLLNVVTIVVDVVSARVRLERGRTTVAVTLTTESVKVEDGAVEDVAVVDPEAPDVAVELDWA